MSVPFALSLSKYVNSVGTDIGFASLLGVALLALLYFSGARESRTLQDELAEAHERIAGLEARLAQTLRNGGADPRADSGSGSTAAARAAGSPPERAQPGAATPNGAAPAVGLRPAAAMAMAGPALGSASTTLPLPATSPSPAPPAAVAPAAAAATGEGSAYATVDDDEGGYTDENTFGPDEHTFGPDDTLYVPPATAGVGGRAGGYEPTPPPRFPPGAARAGHRDEDSADAGPPPRRTIPTVPARRRPRRVRGLAGGLVLLGVLVLAVIVLLAATGSGRAPAPAARHSAARRTRPQPGAVRARAAISVLNGTAVGGLAAKVAHGLTADGYTVPPAAIANAAEQTDTTTVVGYLPGYRAEALAVAHALSRATGVSVTGVAPASTAAITACATPTASGATGTCLAKVIVTVGSDLAGASNGAGTTSQGATSGPVG